jgi:DMSO/TMAO reductase YedYZ molybdopterin-dependent catalytic subunit
MTQPPISRGFRGRRPDGRTDRLPPGQHLTSDFPVLSTGPTPHTDLKTWNFSLYDSNTAIAQWNWAEFEALPQTSVKVDIHCVTTWSKLDTHWQGVTMDTLLDAAGLSTLPVHIHEAWERPAD